MAYQVTDELLGVGGEGIRGQSNTKSETALSLGRILGEAPRVEGNARVRVGKGYRRVVLGKGRRQDYKASKLVTGRTVSHAKLSDLRAAARAPIKREEVLILDRRDWFASTLPAYPTSTSNSSQPRGRWSSY